MTITQLILKSLKHYWRTNLAVLLGVIAATAVIGGALIVGDSVRDSLRQMTLDRLGEVDYALVAHRFLREDLAGTIRESTGSPNDFSEIAPAIVMSCSGQHTFDDTSLRAGQMNVVGLDERLWEMLETGEAAIPGDDSVVINQRVAEQLGAVVGNTISLWIEIPATIPRDSLLGQRDDSTRELQLAVSAIVDDELGAARFAMNPSQQLPLNAFVSLETLQKRLGLAKTRDRRTRVETPGRVNALFSSSEVATATGDAAAVAADKLSFGLNQTLTLEDLRLKLRVNEEPAYVSLESEQLILEDSVVRAAESAAADDGFSTSPVLVYLVNEFARGDAEETPVSDYSAYSLVAGLDFPSTEPFGPFEFDGPPVESLASDEIVVNSWLAEDLQVGIGDQIRLRFHGPESHGDEPELEERFTIRGIVMLGDSPADDRGLAPVVPGITDVEKIDDWDQPFEMDNGRITDRDDQYWEDRRATPKAFLSADRARELWDSRYGSLTSFRFAKPELTTDAARSAFEKRLLEELDPAGLSLAFQPVKAQGLEASVGANDFTGLFLAFSFFLILSAAILIGLLFRLGLERRVSGIGLLSAVGFPPKKVRQVFMGEGLALVVVGGVLGSLAAVAYAALMIHGLKTWWFGAIGTQFLELSITPKSLIAGFLISLIVMSLVVWWGLRGFRRLSARELLSGVTRPVQSIVGQQNAAARSKRIAGWTGGVATALTVASVVGLVPDSEAFSGFSWRIVIFFVVGLGLLTASMFALAGWLGSRHTASVRGKGVAGVSRLGLANASRERQRSVLTAALIAFATFVIVAVAAGHKNPAVERPDPSSGNGGFTLVAESSQSVLQDPQTVDGQTDLGFNLSDEERRLLDESSIVRFRVKDGEDASCLNLYQTQRPRLLGAPDAVIDRGGFSFADTPSDAPWTLLNEELPDIDELPVVPVLGDLNTLQYSLKKGIGSTIAMPNDESPEYLLQITGMFSGSIFQGVLVMSEENFERFHPEESGYRYFLIETPAALESSRQVAELLETQLESYGLDVSRVADRLAEFLAVQNTYLSTFQTLGGFGLLLGTLGLATVMLRNVLERRSELALMRGVGFRNSSLTWLVLAENALLLLWGLVSGTASALVAMGPHLMTTGADVPWNSLIWMLTGVIVVGMLAALFAVIEAVRTPIVATLRAE